MDHFEPQFLLGITATPKRMDGDDVFSLFDQNVPYELRLREAIVNQLVVPFHYYGICDELIEYGIRETMKGTWIINGVVYAFVTVIKNDGTKEGQKYVDGYIDRNTFQWETIANVTPKELAALKASERMEIFVRKVDNEDGIQLPFTYIGSGKWNT